MEVTFILMVVLVTLLLLVGAVLIYLYFYKRHINNMLQKPQAKRKKMLPPHVLISILLVFLIVVVIVTVALDMELDLSQSRLTTKEEILANARIGYEDMQSEISMSGDVAAVLNFKDDLSDCDFKVYINKNSNHPDYVFRRGADLTSVERAAYLLEYNGTYVLISLNAPRIAEIRCENGTTYSVDPNAPFVLVIPDGGSLLSKTGDIGTGYYDYTGIVVYDNQGNEIDLTQIQWFEMSKIN